MEKRGMIIIELSERRLMTVVTLPMPGSQEKPPTQSTCNAMAKTMHFALAAMILIKIMRIFTNTKFSRV